MKVIIEEVAQPENPYFKVYVRDNGTDKFLKVFSYKYGEDTVSIYNREKNYDQALNHAKLLEVFLSSGLPETKIVYENEIHKKED